MATILIQIVTTDVGPHAQVVVPHSLNINGVAIRPDLVMGNRSGVTLDANKTTVTVINNTSSTINLDIWLERKHTIDRALGGVLSNLNPQPFVPAPDHYDETVGKVALLANIAADAGVNGVPYNLQSSTHSGAGVYTLALTTALLDVNNAIVTVAAANGTPIPVIGWSWTNTSTLVIHTQNPATGAAVDSAFTVSVRTSI